MAEDRWVDLQSYGFQNYSAYHCAFLSSSNHQPFFFLQRSNSTLWRYQYSLEAIAKHSGCTFSRRIWVKWARFAASKAVDSHQEATQPRETVAGVLTAWQHMQKGSEASRGAKRLSAVLESDRQACSPGCDCIRSQLQRFVSALLKHSAS